MDFIFLLFGLGGAGAVYAGAGAITGRVLLTKLLAEKQFHLQRSGKEFFIVAGPRRNDLRLADVKSYERGLRSLVAATVFSWPRVLLSLSRPAREKAGEIAGGLRQRAISSQRNRLGVALMERKLDEHPIMELVYSAETDEAFELLRNAVRQFDKEGKLVLTEEQRKQLAPPKSNELVALYPRNKTIIPSNSSFIRKEDGLPEGYLWIYSLRKGFRHDELYVSIEEAATGKILREDYLFPDIYISETDRRREIAAIKKKLLLLFESDIDPERYKNKILESIR